MKTTIAVRSFALYLCTIGGNNTRKSTTNNPVLLRLPSSWLTCSILLFSMAFFATTAHAQRWEYAYGDSCTEGGWKGVRPVPARGLLPAGFIAVGESNSPTGCGQRDIYVVRTDLNGARVWEFTYNISGDDIGYDIEECAAAPGAPASGTAVGDFIITGATDNTTTGGGAGCGSGLRSVFLLRITAAGAIVWAQVYSSTTGTSEGLEVVETTTGNALFGTAVGDFAVAGSYARTNQAPDAYLLRAGGAAGALIWDMTYGGNTPDRLYGVDEAIVGVGTGTGDIIATGWTRILGTQDVIVLRVDGNTGAINGAPTSQGMLVYGDGTYVDVGRAIRELRTGTYAGDLVITGVTTKRVGNSTNGEILVFRTTPNPCTVQAERIYGDDSSGIDEGWDVQEIRSNNAGLTTGNIVVTGYTREQGFGGEDMFLLEVTPNNLLLAGLSFAVYGGTGNDRGHSLLEVPNTVATGATAGYILCGHENSNLQGSTPSQGQQLYLVRVDANGNSGDDCDEDFPDPGGFDPNLTRTCTTAVKVAVASDCTPGIVSTGQIWDNKLCASDQVGKRIRQQETIEPEIATVLQVHTTPNPVRAGSIVKVRWEGTLAAEATITVTNGVGERLLSIQVNGQQQKEGIGITTANWPAGTYYLALSDGVRTGQSELVVIK